MQLTTPEIVLWYSAILLELLVFGLAFWRRLYLHLPVFTGYLTVVIVREVFIYWVYYRAGYTSQLAFYSFWASQAVQLAGRAASVGELAWCASRPYPGFRVVLRWVLPGIALVLLLRAAFVATENAWHLPSFVLTLEREFELTAAVLLVTLFALARWYQVGMETFQRLIAAGLFVYSLVQVLNNAISRQWLESYFHWWDAVRVASFHAALAIWLIALAKPLPAPAKMPAPPDPHALRDFMRQGTEVIHQLAARLRRFRKRSGK